MLLVINASPWHRAKKAERLAVLKAVARETNCPILYCNQVGAQDSLIFDGSSCVISSYGEVRQQLPSFVSAFALVEVIERQPIWAHNPLAFENLVNHADSVLNDLYQALCLGVRDYVYKNGFSRVLLGLSGGIDSALTLAIALDALGKESVRAVMLPSVYTSSMSLEDAEAMAKQVGVRYDVLPIGELVSETNALLSPLFMGKSIDATEENLQARLRGVLLMALSNKHGELLLTTSNKSEAAVGYSTLYGDMCGGLAVLSDVTKHWVYALSHYRNRLGRIIPERILQRPPSAELRPDQTDQENLPPYDILDAIIEFYVEQGLSIDEIVAQGFERGVVQRMIRLIHQNEYKRQQSAIGLKVSAAIFGDDWRFPLTQKWLNQGHLSH
jgi:NAD+ synthase (glutamine-hydrolysing)